MQEENAVKPLCIIMALPKCNALVWRLKIPILCFQLLHRGGPIFKVMDFDHLSVFNGVDVNGHDLERFASIGGRAHEIALGRARSHAPHNHGVAILVHILDFPFQVGDQLPEKLDLSDELRLALGVARAIGLEIIGEEFAHRFSHVGSWVDGQALGVERPYDFF